MLMLGPLLEIGHTFVGLSSDHWCMLKFPPRIYMVDDHRLIMLISTVVMIDFKVMSIPTRPPSYL